MSWNKTVFSALLAGVIPSAALVENAIAQVVIRTGPSTASKPISKLPKEAPCWEVAGVPKSAIQQRRTIGRQARQEIGGVRKFVALDPAEAATDPTDSSVGTTGG